MAALPNKGSTGQPSQYFVRRDKTPTITLYLTPDASTYTYLKYYYMGRIERCRAYTNQEGCCLQIFTLHDVQDLHIFYQ